MLTICSVALRFDFNPAPSTLCSQFDSSEITYETHLTRMRDKTEVSEISTEMEVAFLRHCSRLVLVLTDELL